MSTLGASRFTALLAAVAISGMAGAFWWALDTRSDSRGAGRHGITRMLPAKLITDRVPRGRDGLAGGADSDSADPRTSALNPDPKKSDTDKFTLMGTSTRPPDQDPPAPPLLANFQSGPRNPDLPNAALTRSPEQNRGLQVTDLQGLASPPPGSRADMPLPALPVPPPPRPDQTRWSPKFPDPPAFTPPPPATTAENPKRPTHAPPTTIVSRRPPKAPPVPSYYVEKYFDQGDYHYRRRPCEPPNMPDVCFMPQANRQPILVARP